MVPHWGHLVAPGGSVRVSKEGSRVPSWKCGGLARSREPSLRRQSHRHPYAIPPFPGAQGLWLIQVGSADPLGYIRSRTVRGGFDVYAHCRDDVGGLPWGHAATPFNSAVAWAVQHDAEIRALIARSAPDPDSWPPPQQPLGGAELKPRLDGKRGQSSLGRNRGGFV